MDDLNDDMGVDDQSQSPNSRTFKTFPTGSLSSSLSNLSSSSKNIPSSQDFHFFYNFNEFKLPIQQIAAKSQSLLNKIGDSSHIWGKSLPFPDSADADEDIAYDWLVNVNDEFFERFDVSGDDFARMRKKEEETGKPMTSMADGGFKVVYGKKKSRAAAMEANDAISCGSRSVEVGAKMALRDKKGRISFHIPTIRKPQEEYNILVNNLNQQFEHVWLERSEDGTQVIHPLEKLSVLDFVDKDIGNVSPMEPPSVETTPFTLVQEVKELKELAVKLCAVNEFAVDLEHNQYRSFQGLTCLMQISTRTEDFVVDTLKLRIHVGPYLREIFKDPTKKKVMHGADRDIVWLQRDFGIYVCNLFDTGQASRVLKLERNSLEYLLHHYCGVTANKEYQNADWRLRPIPDEMLRYAREDTHYLLYIYDLMRINLSSTPKESEDSDAPLVEVYKRSYDVCMQLYQKEIFTENSFLYIYGLPTTFNAQQLAIVSGLYQWRDIVARAEDESTGYILPNKTLLEIAKQVPLSASKLRQLVKSKHSYVERNLASVLSVIRSSIQNAAEFEAVAERLKNGLPETVSQDNDDETQGSPLENSTSDGLNDTNSTISPVPGHLQESGAKSTTANAKTETGSRGPTFEKPDLHSTVSSPSKDENTDKSTLNMAKDTGASVQVLKKPSGAFGALLGSSASKRKVDSNKKETEVVKLEQIRSLVSLPFHSFAGGHKPEEPVTKEPTRVSEVSDSKQPAASSKVEEFIMLEERHDALVDRSHSNSDTANKDGEDDSRGSASEEDKEEGPMSLSELSSSFQKCLQAANDSRKSRHADKSQEPQGLMHQLKPFDYEEARKEIQFDKKPSKERSDNDSKADSRRGRKGSATQQGQGDNGTEFRQGRRRQAFPASGNRSSTFR